MVVEIEVDGEFLRYSDGVYDQCGGNSSSGSKVHVLLFGFKGEEYWLIQGPFG